MRVRLQRIPPEHEHVDLALRDAGADLLVAAVRAAYDGAKEFLLNWDGSQQKIGAAYDVLILSG